MRGQLVNRSLHVCACTLLTESELYQVKQQRQYRLHRKQFAVTTRNGPVPIFLWLGLCRACNTVYWLAERCPK
jgi:hypothetical protein